MEMGAFFFRNDQSAFECIFFIFSLHLSQLVCRRRCVLMRLGLSKIKILFAWLPIFDFLSLFPLMARLIANQCLYHLFSFSYFSLLTTLAKLQYCFFAARLKRKNWWTVSSLSVCKGRSACLQNRLPVCLLINRSKNRPHFSPKWALPSSYSLRIFCLFLLPCIFLAWKWTSISGAGDLEEVGMPPFLASTFASWFMMMMMMRAMLMLVREVC